ncbi:hypothetical protein Ahia01_001095500 [Argonauta hians]
MAELSAQQQQHQHGPSPECVGKEDIFRTGSFINDTISVSPIPLATSTAKKESTTKPCTSATRSPSPPPPAPSSDTQATTTTTTDATFKHPGSFVPKKSGRKVHQTSIGRIQNHKDSSHGGSGDLPDMFLGGDSRKHVFDKSSSVMSTAGVPGDPYNLSLYSDHSMLSNASSLGLVPDELLQSGTESLLGPPDQKCAASSYSSSSPAAAAADISMSSRLSDIELVRRQVMAPFDISEPRGLFPFDSGAGTTKGLVPPMGKASLGSERPVSSARDPSLGLGPGVIGGGGGVGPLNVTETFLKMQMMSMGDRTSHPPIVLEEGDLEALDREFELEHSEVMKGSLALTPTSSHTLTPIHTQTPTPTRADPTVTLSSSLVVIAPGTNTTTTTTNNKNTNSRTTLSSPTDATGSSTIIPSTSTTTTKVTDGVGNKKLPSMAPPMEPVKRFTKSQYQDNYDNIDDLLKMTPQYNPHLEEISYCSTIGRQSCRASSFCLEKVLGEMAGSPLDTAGHSQENGEVSNRWSKQMNSTVMSSAGNVDSLNIDTFIDEPFENDLAYRADFDNFVEHMPSSDFQGLSEDFQFDSGISKLDEAEAEFTGGNGQPNYDPRLERSLAPDISNWTYRSHLSFMSQGEKGRMSVGTYMRLGSEKIPNSSMRDQSLMPALENSTASSTLHNSQQLTQNSMDSSRTTNSQLETSRNPSMEQPPHHSMENSRAANSRPETSRNPNTEQPPHHSMENSRTANSRLETSRMISDQTKVRDGNNRGNTDGTTSCNSTLVSQSMMVSNSLICDMLSGVSLSLPSKEIASRFETQVEQRCRSRSRNLNSDSLQKGPKLPEPNSSSLNSNVSSSSSVVTTTATTATAAASTGPSQGQDQGQNILLSSEPSFISSNRRSPLVFTSESSGSVDASGPQSLSMPASKVSDKAAASTRAPTSAFASAAAVAATTKSAHLRTMSASAAPIPCSSFQSATQSSQPADPYASRSSSYSSTVSPTPGNKPRNSELPSATSSLAPAEPVPVTVPVGPTQRGGGGSSGRGRGDGKEGSRGAGSRGGVPAHVADVVGEPARGGLGGCVGGGGGTGGGGGKMCQFSEDTMRPGRLGGLARPGIGTGTCPRPRQPAEEEEGEEEEEAVGRQWGRCGGGERTRVDATMQGVYGNQNLTVNGSEFDKSKLWKTIMEEPLEQTQLNPFMACGEPLTNADLHHHRNGNVNSVGEAMVGSAGSNLGKVGSRPLLEVSSLVNFSDCCLGISERSYIALRNLSANWLECTIELTRVLLNGHHIDTNKYNPFLFKPKAALSPMESKDHEVLFLPQDAGTYVAEVKVQSFSQAATTTTTSGHPRPAVSLSFAHFVALEAVADFPRLHIEPKTLDFGKQCWGSSKSLPLKLANKGTVKLPLRLVIASQGVFRWDCDSVAENMKKGCNYTVSNNIIGSVTLPVCQPGSTLNMLALEVFCDLDKNSVFKDPSRCVPLEGNVELQLDVPQALPPLAVIPLSVVAGDYRLKIVSGFNPIKMEASPLAPCSRYVTLENSGTFDFDVRLFFNHNEADVFSLDSDQRSLTVGQIVDVEVNFQPTEESGKSYNTELVIYLLPSGPAYVVPVHGDVITGSQLRPKIVSDTSDLNFGGVGLGDEKSISLNLKNMSVSAANLMLAIRSDLNCFKIPLFGYGGRSAVRLLDSTSSSCGALQLQHTAHCQMQTSLVVRNDGDRDGFFGVKAFLDRECTQLAGPSVSIKPENGVLKPTELREVTVSCDDDDDKSSLSFPMYVSVYHGDEVARQHMKWVWTKLGATNPKRNRKNCEWFTAPFCEELNNRESMNLNPSYYRESSFSLFFKHLSLLNLTLQHPKQSSSSSNNNVIVHRLSHSSSGSGGGDEGTVEAPRVLEKQKQSTTATTTGTSTTTAPSVAKGTAMQPLHPFREDRTSSSTTAATPPRYPPYNGGGVRDRRASPSSTSHRFSSPSSSHHTSFDSTLRGSASTAAAVVTPPHRNAAPLPASPHTPDNNNNRTLTPGSEHYQSHAPTPKCVPDDTGMMVQSECSSRVQPEHHSPTEQPLRVSLTQSVIEFNLEESSKLACNYLEITNHSQHTLHWNIDNQVEFPYFSNNDGKTTVMQSYDMFKIFEFTGALCAGDTCQIPIIFYPQVFLDFTFVCQQTCRIHFHWLRGAALSPGSSSSVQPSPPPPPPSSSSPSSLVTFSKSFSLNAYLDDEVLNPKVIFSASEMFLSFLNDPKLSLMIKPNVVAFYPCPIGGTLETKVIVKNRSHQSIKLAIIDEGLDSPFRANVKSFTISPKKLVKLPIYFSAAVKGFVQHRMVFSSDSQSLRLLLFGVGV